MSSTLPHEFVLIDEQGLPRTSDHQLPPEIGAEILRNLRQAENGSIVTEVSGQKVLIEAFDAPLIAKSVKPPESKGQTSWTIEFPHQVQKKFSLSDLSCDEWDRFHGLTSEAVPFVLSAKAQDELFNAADEFTDDSLTFRGKKYPIREWLATTPAVEAEKFWSDIYKNESPGWDLGKASPILQDLLPRLKIPKSRILVLGCGPGHDAAFFAEQGHVVTAVDISDQALQLAKSNYPFLKNINWVQSDIFHLPQDWQGQFDIVFEHTCYCAINPKRRNELVKTWLKLLAPQGHLLGVFFAIHQTPEKRQGPPFGGSEWEIRKRLKNNFHFIFWGRWRQSTERRHGTELAVYAAKKS